MKAALLTLVFLLFSPLAQAYKVAVLYDQYSAEQAFEFKQRFHTLLPFYKINKLEVELISTQQNRLNCVQQSERVFTCDRVLVDKAREKAKADVIFVFVYFRTGHSMGTGLRKEVYVGTYRSNWFYVAIHEFLHVLNFADEYAHPQKAEANIFCQNLVRQLEKAPKHNLSAKQTEYYRYPAKTCIHAEPKVLLWQPIRPEDKTVMNTSGSLNIPTEYEEAIFSEIGLN